MPNILEYPPEWQATLETRKSRTPDLWEADPVTAKQLVKLKFSKIPFHADGLTKGKASALIDAFIGMDPETEAAYQDRPLTPSQRAKLLKLGVPTEGMAGYTYAEARDRIEDLVILRRVMA